MRMTSAIGLWIACTLSCLAGSPYSSGPDLRGPDLRQSVRLCHPDRVPRVLAVGSPHPQSRGPMNDFSLPSAARSTHRATYCLPLRGRRFLFRHDLEHGAAGKNDVVIHRKNTLHEYETARRAYDVSGRLQECSWHDRAEKWVSS